MNNKNIFKYLIIIAIVVLVIVATVLIILNTKVKNPNIQEDVGEEDLPELEIDESIEKIDQINTFSMVEKIVNSNIDSNTTFFATEIYFQEIDVVLAYRLYVFGEIFDIGNQSYQNVFFAIDFDEESSNYKITQKKLDIEQSEYEQIAKSGAQKYLITDNYNGEFLQEDISDNLVVKRYFDYYKMLMITNPEKAYSLLDDEYKKIKFENYNNFYTYINNKIAQIKAMELSKLQVNYFDDPDIVGFTRLGDDDHYKSGMAVIISDRCEGRKRMYVGKNFAGEKFEDALGHREDEIVIDEEGFGNFVVNGGQVSVYIKI